MSDTDRQLSVLRSTIGSGAFGGPVVEKAGDAAKGEWQPDYWQTLSTIFGFGPGSVRTMSQGEALQLSAVLICLDVLSQDIAKTGLYLKRRTRGGSERVLPREHWLAKYLALEPNQFHTWYEFIEMTMLNLGMVQNAFIAKKTTRTGEVIEAVPIMPGRVIIWVTPDQKAYYYTVNMQTFYDAVLYQDFDLTLTQDEMVHLRGRMFDGINGYSNLVAGAKTMGLARSVNDFQTRLYENDGQFRGVFQSKDNIEVNQDTFDRLRDQLAEGMTAMRRIGRPLILDGGVQFQQVSMKANEAEVSTAMDAAIVSVCRMFRMPPHKAMHLQAVKYENLEAMEKSYVSDTLVPYCTRLEQRLDQAFLSAEERLDYFLEFDRESMVITDVAQQAVAEKVGLGNGAMTIDEYRQKHGYNPLPNKAGQVRLIPANMQLIDDKNEVVLQAGNPAGTGAGSGTGQDGGDGTGDGEPTPAGGKKKPAASGTTVN